MGRLVISGNSVYEVDEEYCQRKKETSNEKKEKQKKNKPKRKKK